MQPKGAKSGHLTSYKLRQRGSRGRAIVTESTTATEKAGAQLKALLEEQAGLTARVVEAAGRGDGKALVDLQRRGDDLPHLIVGARVKHLHAQLQEAGRRHPEVLAERDAAYRELGPLHEKVKVAQEELLEAQARHGSLHSQERTVREQRRRIHEALEAELDGIVGSQSHAPVMRYKVNAGR